MQDRAAVLALIDAAEASISAARELIEDTEISRPDPVEPPVQDSGFKWSDRSQSRLEEVHPDLKLVMDRALRMSRLDLAVIEGVRTLERQRELVNSGASQTMKSRHLTGHAVDIAPLDPATGKVSWDWPLYHQIAKTIKEAAELEGVQIEWGGDWKSFKDGPHWQLPWDA